MPSDSELDSTEDGTAAGANEGVAAEQLLYHLDAGVGVDMNIFRPGSTAFFRLFREARKLYSEGRYEPKNINELELLEDSDIGRFAFYEGKLVPLDYPVLEGDEALKPSIPLEVLEEKRKRKEQMKMLTQGEQKKLPPALRAEILKKKKVTQNFLCQLTVSD